MVKLLTMVRSAFAEEHLISYINDVAKQNTYSVGLILGQSLAGKEYIVHFAKTPPFQSHDERDTSRITNIDDVNEDWVADHARQATRTLPGDMHVLGLFIVSPEDLLNPFPTKIKNILNRTHKHLNAQKYLFGNPSNNDRLVLNFCATTQQFSCKNYDIGTGSVHPIELKFINTPLKWIQIECNYQMDQIYQIAESENYWPLKKHMGIILDTMDAKLKSSVFLFDGELKDGDESIETIGKKQVSRTSKSSTHEDHLKPLQVCIMQPCESNEEKTFEMNENGNQIRIFGHVISKVWVNPKVPINLASEAVMQDIMRSLATRLEMHWDSLTEEEHGEDMNSVHEPPRRVLITLSNSKIAVSDYLFPGEGPHDAKTSLEEILDIKVHDSSVQDVEGQADLTDYYNDAMESESEEVIVKKPTGSSKSLYYIGLGVALLVLIISLVIHFIQQS